MLYRFKLNIRNFVTGKPFFIKQIAMKAFKPFYLIGIVALFLISTCTPSSGQTDYEAERKKMVTEQLITRGITNGDVVKAMLKVPRHLFVPIENRYRAYGDHPIVIGEGQTISQPYIVALMSQLVNPKAGIKVLEIGTGSGYQAAILAEMGLDVFSIEIIDKLGLRAEILLDSIGYSNIKVKIGDGYQGWQEYAPYDVVIVTCSPSDVPKPLTDQLKDGGILIIPVGTRTVQELVVLKKRKDKITKSVIAPVMFVPMVTPEGERY